MTTKWYEDNKYCIDKNHWDDGQTIEKLFAREYRGQWQYAVVTYSDDGTPIDATTFYNGKRKVFEYESDY